MNRWEQTLLHPAGASPLRASENQNLSEKEKEEEVMFCARKTRLVLGASVFVVLTAATLAIAGPGGQPPIKVGPIAVVATPDTGTCNNVWAVDSFNKFYTITANRDGTYNVQVSYKDGTFVTNAGASPGACESGVNNGSTVASAVMGNTHQEYNGTVIGTLSGASCDATCVDTTSILNKLFNSGWGWMILSDGGHWTWEGHYEAGSNGTWFDTNVNWPLNDRGDITGSPR